MRRSSFGSVVEGCGPKAKCESRDQRAQLQWRLGRLDGGFGCGMRVFSVAGGADPGRGAEHLSERHFLAWNRIRISGFAAIVLKDVA